MMNLLLRKSNSLLRVGAAAVGSGLLCANRISDSESTVSVSVPAPLRESLSLPWKLALEPGYGPAFMSSQGIFPLFSPRVSPDPYPYPNAEKEVHVDAGGDAKQKPCPRCLTRDSMANAAALVGPAVVHISVERGFNFGLFSIVLEKEGMGSGTIIDEDGTILTCSHVVLDSKGLLQTPLKGKVEVTLQDGRTFEGTVLNANIHSDIALVKINSTTPLPTANLGCSSSLHPGDRVLAVGGPFSLQNTVTAGIVSCVDRKSSDIGLGGMRGEYLQTDCAINMGSSGGPLVNVDGEVIGVVSWKIPGAVGVSFAVPIDSVTKIIEHFKKRG